VSADQSTTQMTPRLAQHENQFDTLFRTLTDRAPFPWQMALYERFTEGVVPHAADIPTGLGKTSVVVIWLIALITHPEKMPRRLVYVVNRRTVVDQTTVEVERLRERLHGATELSEELKLLRKRCGLEFQSPLAISTLRGQFADNREWCADPSRPAVIIGTVDMIGSGLLFSRYTAGFKARPLQAGFLGQDALVVHDEAHLEPAFQKLLENIVAEQLRCREGSPLRVIQLSATTRGAESTFTLTPKDEQDERVKKRLRASKRLVIHPIDDEKHLADNLLSLALARRNSGRAVLIFCCSVDVVLRVAEGLEKQKLAKETLTGTKRGRERDELVKQKNFLRFLPPSSRPENTPKPTEGTVYLVATSAGEVGVNISADDLICDLSTWESMAQRFGRVNRFGETTESTIEVVHPINFKTDDPREGTRETARARTLELLKQLEGDVSPEALRKKLDSKAREEAFSPLPEMLPANNVPVSDILFDAWSLTTIRGALPGRPPVAEYLHGIAAWQPPETWVAWRDEVDLIKDDLLLRYEPEELLEDYPLKPHELLRDVTDRKGSGVLAQLQKLAARYPKAPVWILDPRDQLRVMTLEGMVARGPELLYDATVILPPSVGGLTKEGMLNGNAKPEDCPKLDVADEWFDEQDRKRRVRLWDHDAKLEEAKGMRLVRAPLDIDPTAEERDEDAEASRRFWYWFTRPRSADDDLSKTSTEPVPLQRHTDDVVANAQRIAKALNLPTNIQEAVVLAAKLHDLGKRRVVWQRSIGNPRPSDWHAKSGRLWKPCDICPDYRHEFGSLRDVIAEDEFRKLEPDEQDLVLHLIAAHHGRARPHFPLEEAHDREGDPAQSEAIAIEVPRRFARLQRRFGRWGLAYLESMLRAADYAASAGISPKQTTS
jgi:CRISPR-associated endonuclease/helicase Cas3